MPDPASQLTQGRDSAGTLKSAIITARKAREKFEPFWKKYNQEIKGRHRKNAGNIKRLTNYAYLFERAYMPQLAAHSPNVWVEAELQWSDAAVAEITGLAIRRCIERQKFIEQLRLSVRDSFYAFLFGKTVVFPGGDGELGGFYGDPMWMDANMPGYERISPFEALWDDSVDDFARTAYCGHEFTRSLELVLEDERYDAAARTQAENAKSRMRDRDKERHASFDDNDIPPFCNLMELFVRPTAMLYTVMEVSAQEFVILRKAPFVGPPNGPYHMKALADCDEVVGMAPACAWWDAYVEREKNEQRANEDAQAERRIATCDEAEATSAEKYKNAKPNDLVPGVKDIHEVQTGGVTESRLAWLDRTDARLQLLSGVTAVRMGIAQKGNTATGDYIANSNADADVQDKRRSVVNFALEVLDDIKFYIHTDPNFATRTTVTDPAGQQSEVMIRGGPETDPLTGEPVPGQSPPTDFHVRLDPRSLYMDDDQIQQQKAMRDMELVLTQLRPFLNSQGFDLNAVGMVREFAQAAKIPSLMRNLMPMSPMAMMLMQQATQGAPTSEGVDQAASPGAGGGGTQGMVQSAAMNNPDTSQGIQDMTSFASLPRMAATLPGANNQETSPYP